MNIGISVTGTLIPYSTPRAMAGLATELRPCHRNSKSNAGQLESLIQTIKLIHFPSSGQRFYSLRVKTQDFRYRSGRERESGTAGLIHNFIPRGKMGPGRLQSGPLQSLREVAFQFWEDTASHIRALRRGRPFFVSAAPKPCVVAPEIGPGTVQAFAICVLYGRCLKSHV